MIWAAVCGHVVIRGMIHCAAYADLSDICCRLGHGIVQAQCNTKAMSRTMALL